MTEEINMLKQHCKFESEQECYVIFGIARKKNNKDITNAQEVVFREVIKSVSNIEKKYTKIKTQCESYRTVDNKKLNFYIYISVNPRDVTKGYIEFKKKLLVYEEEMLRGVPCTNQLKRVDSLWLSSLMLPKARSSNVKRFTLDVDTKDLNIMETIGICLEKVGISTNSIKDLQEVETKNGWHFITKPFNKGEFVIMIMDNKLQDVCEVKTDALLFVENIEGD